MTRRYVVTAFAVSWALAGLQYLVVPDEGAGRQIVTTLIGAAYMFGPLVGAVVAQRAAGEKVLRPLGALAAPNRWWLVGVLGMFGYAWLCLGAGLLWPDVTWSGDMSGLFERLSGTLPPDALAEAKAELETMPGGLLPVLMSAQALVAGVTINAVAGFGEELGWRGFLYERWRGLGFWKSAFAIGAVWGVWHAPLILQGHNYPAHPVLGVVWMTAWCVALAPLFQYVRLRSGSVIAAAMMHGTLNASAGFGMMFLRGGSDLEVGATGAVGIAVAVGLNLLLWLFARPAFAPDAGS